MANSSRCWCATPACEQCAGPQDRPLGCEWLADLLECGDVIRYRRKLVEHRSSELQRLGNVLQDAGIKADSVASSITIKSVRAMVEALIDGERRPPVSAELARGRMRSKISDLQRALKARFNDHHAPDVPVAPGPSGPAR